MPDCKKFLIEKHGLSPDEADTLIREVQDMGASTGGERPSVKAKRAVQQEIANLDAKAAYERKAAILNIAADERQRVKVDAFENKATGIEAATVGAHAWAGPGSRNSTDFYRINSARQVLAALTTDLEKTAGKNLGKLSGDMPFNLDVTREMWAGADGSTGNNLARDVAAVLMRHKDALVERANAAGAFIKHLPGHVFAQTHDPRLLVKMGKEAWVRTILPLLDAEKTFRGAPEARHAEILGEIWTNIVTGTRAGDQGRKAGFGGSSMAARLSRDRVLHFLNADAFDTYNRQFGRQTALQAIFSNMERLAKDTALMEQWGPDPDRTFQKLLGKHERGIREEQAVSETKWRPWTMRDPIKQLENFWSHLTGTANIPSSYKLASLFQGWRNWNVATKMGGVVVSSFPDTINIATMAKANGVNFLERWNGILTSFTPDSPAKKQALRTLGFAVDSTLADIHSRISAVDGAPGFSSGMANLMFKINFLRSWTDALDGGQAWAYSSMLADALDRPFEAADEGFRTTLAQYNLGPKQWEHLRAAVHDVENGIKVVSPEHIADFDTRASYMAFIQDQVDTAILKPGARERGLLLTAQPGTWWGEAQRSMLQFKMFSLSTVTRLLPQVTRDGMLPLIPYALAMTAMGYVSNTVTDLYKGRLPHIPEDSAQAANIFAAALVRSGGMGIIGDMILHDYGKYGQGLLTTLAGPTAGQLEQVGKLLADVAHGRVVGSEAFRMAVGNTPFLNLFYAKGAVDYLLVNQVLEFMNPGYLNRMERRLKDEGSGMWLSP